MWVKFINDKLEESGWHIDIDLHRLALLRFMINCGYINKVFYYATGLCQWHILLYTTINISESFGADMISFATSQRNISYWKYHIGAKSKLEYLFWCAVHCNRLFLVFEGNLFFFVICCRYDGFTFYIENMEFEKSQVNNH